MPLAFSKKFNKKAVLKAMRGSGGIKSGIAQTLNVTRKTLDNWFAEYPELEQARCDEMEAVIDIAEIELIKHIRNGDKDMIKFALRTKGKKRGYQDALTFGNSDGTPVVIEIVEK